MAQIALKTLGEDIYDDGLVTLVASQLRSSIERYLPDGALATKFYDDVGRQLFLVGTPAQITAADAFLNENSTVVYNSITFTFQDN